MANKRKTSSDTDERVTKLEIRVKKLEKERKKLISDNRTLQNALEKTEEYIMAISKDKNVSHIIDEIESSKLNKECPNCGNKKMHKTNYGEFYIETCEYKNCGYRNRIHEARSNKT